MTDASLAPSETIDIEFSQHDQLKKLTYSAEEVAELFGISRSAVFDLFRTGQIKRSKILTRTVVTADEVRRFYSSLAAEVQ